MQFITFEKWLELNPTPPPEHCPECEGEGRHSCSCGHEHRCDTCDGTGFVSGFDPIKAARQQYEMAKAKEVAKLAAWGIAV